MDQTNALIDALRQALETTPALLPLRRQLTELLIGAGRFDEAQVEARQALDLAPQDSGLKILLAEAYLGNAKPEVALVVLEEIQRGLAHNPALLSAEQSAKVAKLAAEARQPSGAAPAAALKAPPSGKTPDLSAGIKVLSQAVEGGGEVELERPKIDFSSVGGMEALKEEIRMKILYPLSQPELFAAYGKKLGGGILMYGPPGCGKTHLARATAGEIKARFLAVGIHDVLDMYLGQSEQKLHEVFELARANTPCVLFFDEVDALGANRRDMRQNAGRQVINQLLAELDGLSGSNEGVLVLAATNAPWHLDPALRRPGRFDRVLFVPPPDEPARSLILEIMLSGKPVEQIDFKRLARETEQFSGADLKGLVDRAVEAKLQEAMRKGSVLPLGMRDLQSAAKLSKPSTVEWFASARNYAVFANQGGMYDEVLNYMQATGQGPNSLLSKLSFGGKK